MPDGLAGLVRAAQEESQSPVQQTVVEEVEETPRVQVVEKTEPEPAPRAKRGPVPVQHIEADNSWELFKGYVEQYKRDTTKGKEIWINEDIRYELDKMKTASRSSMKLKTMVNAMLHTFMDLHRKEIEDLLAQG